MTAHEEYFAYLQGRSFTGLLYRKLWLYPRLKRHLRGRVLDVGCGIGDFLASRRGAIGVDVNPLLVEWCRKRGLDARVMQPDTLPFAAAQFDSVILDNVLEHIPQPAPLLSEVNRVIVPGGRFVVGVPGVKGFAGDPDHKIFYDEPTLVRVLEAAGFRAERIMHLPLPSRWLDEHLRQFCLYGVFTKARS